MAESSQEEVVITPSKVFPRYASCPRALLLLSLIGSTEEGPEVLVRRLGTHLLETHGSLSGKFKGASALVKIPSKKLAFEV